MRVKELKKALENFDDNLIVVAMDSEGLNLREIADDGWDLCVRTCDFITTEQVNVKQECLIIES